MKKVYIDIESFSEANLKEVGAYVYAEHPSTTVLCIVATQSTGCPILWVEGTPLPPIFRTWANDPEVIFIAHNAPFEFTMLNGVPGQAIGFPPTTIDRWRDTAVKCVAHGLPRDLDGAGAALGLPVQKDKKGHAIMLRLSRPRIPSKANPDTRWTPRTKPEEFDRLYQYCEQDVLTTIGIDNAVPDIPESEQKLWELDQKINQRGYLIDTRTVDHVIKLREEIVARSEDECSRLTGGIFSSQRDQILAWCSARGVTLPGYTKDDLAHALGGQLPEDVRRVLEIRQSVGKVSTKKYAALQRGVCADDRLRGSLMFYGAGTGRWSGRIFQPQNLARGDIENADLYVDDLWDYDLDGLGLLYGDTMNMLSSFIRSMVFAKEGHEFVICDYSSIEARVVQWLAGDQEALEVFRTGKDNYKVMASEIYAVPYEQVTKNQRQVGKQAILGLGYAMGWKKFFDTCQARGLDVDVPLAKRVVDAFRRKYSALKAFWYSMDAAAVQAIRNPGEWVNGGGAGCCSWYSNERWLYMSLPSGRMLAYFQPDVKKARIKTENYDFETDQVIFMGQNSTTRQWEPQKLYGGLSVENCLLEGTMVVTYCGVKPIEQVSTSDLLWDGQSWVDHQGLLNKGIQEVIQLSGVWMTPEHEVLTDDGWKTALELQGSHRRDFWISHDCTTFWKHRQALPLGSSLCMWKRNSGSGKRPDQETRPKSNVLWMYDKRTQGDVDGDSPHEQTSRLCSMEINVGKMSSSKSLCLSQLWRSWNNNLRKLAERFFQFLGRHGSYIQTWINARPNRQQPGLQPEQLPMGDTGSSSEQYQAQSFDKYPPWNYDRSTSSKTVQDKNIHSLLPVGSWVARGRTIHSSRLHKQGVVYDIKNSGPYNRFTIVCPDGGFMIVHNCTQAISRDLLAHGMTNLENRGFPVVLHVHDEAVCETRIGSLTSTQMEDIMCELPAWASGLPIKAEGFVCRRYRK